MRKLLMVSGAVVGGALLARRFAGHCAHFDFEQMVERMPENAPPKWMFHNVSAIRENTDRILKLLEEERTSGTDEQVRTAA